MEESVIYIKHFENGFKYVGYTNNFERRMSRHEQDAKHHYTNLPIHQAMREMLHYTEIVFKTTDKEEAFYMEKVVIQNFKDLGYELYNLTDGGRGTEVMKHSEETKQRLREMNMGENNRMYGKHLSVEVKRKISEALSGEKNSNYGRRLSDKQKKHLSEVMVGKYVGEKNPMYGKTHTEEVKQKLREKNSGQNSPKSRPKEWYETNVSRRDKFKSTCKRMGRNFEDFDEVKSGEIYVTQRGQKYPKYYYVYNPKESANE